MSKPGKHAAQTGRVKEEIDGKFGKLLARYHDVFNLGQEILRDAYVVATGRGKRPTQKTAFLFLGRAILALSATERLFASGHEHDSYSTLRTLVELLIDLRWIMVDPIPRTTLFTEYVWVHSRREEEAMKRTFPGWQKPPTQWKDEYAPYLPNTVRTADQIAAWEQSEYLRVKNNYPRRGSWCPKSIADRATEVGLAPIYELVHRKGSDALHSSMATLGLMFQRQKGAITIICAPHAPRDQIALLLVVGCFCDLMRECDTHLTLNRDKDIERVREDFNRAASVAPSQAHPGPSTP